MSLSERSDEEISQLLAEYAIRHGPIVDSTRKLYEKKLEVAMASAPVAPLSDKTYYREEAEEMTYITYHSAVRQDYDMLKRRGNMEPDEDEESDQEPEPPVQMANRTANHSAVRSRAGGGAWKGIRLLLLLAVLAAGLYYAYCQVMRREEIPSNIQ
ncbi:lamina-associated polypeptide 2, isoforms beta/delta/epsilon/gamma [Cyclopterus lumpus]|uniref:lamina-associated polypeptide 2, isoforms beta/delta/epsilon/gamma n=1 Tax=Cyclopterus lumpus TaxID=8103 RepID=UPI0014865989|nr:lamina-associated polypeptide 2, isoforms beta/delta/epsilon/gamma [Cyclopterus lumpus]XP_034393215.1 lamina-associated polypeptide 2, isoforms beta/delta/epsilon/gamma [Cyclopterus lumpus]